MKPLSNGEKRALKRWRPGKELEEWAGYSNKLPWEGLLKYNEKRSRGCFHPSSLSDPCEMRLLFDLLGEKAKANWPAKVTKAMELGTAIHTMMNYLQDTWADHNGHEHHHDVRVKSEELEIEGTADAVTVGWPLARGVLWEYKSISERAHSKQTSIPRAHMVQAHAYMHCLDLPVAVIVYYNKGMMSFHPHIVHFQPALWKRTTQRLRRIQDCANNAERPPRKVNTSCYNCPYFKPCKPPLPKYSARGAEL